MEIRAENRELIAQKIDMVQKRNGTFVPFDMDKIILTLKRITKNIKDISAEQILKELKRNLFDSMSTLDIERALILSIMPLIEQDPGYSKVVARLLLQKIYKEVLQESITKDLLQTKYEKSFVNQINICVELGNMDKRLLDFDLDYLSKVLEPLRDELFEYLAIQTLYEKYFLKKENRRLELPQCYWMRIAMGLAIKEKEKNSKAIEFYEIISKLDFMPSTPTLLHAGLSIPQLSSCFLSTVDDDLKHIFTFLGNNAQLSKWSGGVANDWTPLRATGAHIKSINVNSQGIIPFLKIANDVTSAISRSGSRRGATCAYLEVWHLDFEDFIDLKRNTGDERRRTHDMNTASWIPDLFMKRVIEDQNWTFFSPDETPDLHDLYGKKFESRYLYYEKKAQDGEIKLHKTIKAVDLWRKMLSRLFETGHPWLTFKDACNIRSPQDHDGVIHSSNLCTEITLNTNINETAVCNLGSINIKTHIEKNQLNKKKLSQTISTAMRILDNVIDINFYPTQESKNSNLRHRPVGLGMMGMQDALFMLNIPFSSPKAFEFADEITEIYAYNAILASSKLAQERGKYESYNGSKWDKGILPQDTVTILENERGIKTDLTYFKERCDWQALGEQIKKFGMRNSNTMAIAPTATISNICGCYPSIEPIYKNMYVKSNMSGEFTIINKYLVEDLKKSDSWNQEIINQIKYFDGSIAHIETIDQELKNKYKTSFEIDPHWLIDITATRGKWIDQSQSHNVFMSGVSGKKLSDLYIHAWKRGLKTTYYLRTLGASQIEKSTLDAKQFGFTQKRIYSKNKPNCTIDDNNCQSCQ